MKHNKGNTLLIVISVIAILTISISISLDKVASRLKNVSERSNLASFTSTQNQGPELALDFLRTYNAYFSALLWRDFFVTASTDTNFVVSTSTATVGTNDYQTLDIGTGNIFNVPSYVTLRSPDPDGAGPAGNVPTLDTGYLSAPIFYTNNTSTEKNVTDLSGLNPLNMNTVFQSYFSPLHYPKNVRLTLINLELDGSTGAYNPLFQVDSEANTPTPDAIERPKHSGKRTSALIEGKQIINVDYAFYSQNAAVAPGGFTFACQTFPYDLTGLSSSCNIMLSSINRSLGTVNRIDADTFPSGTSAVESCVGAGCTKNLLIGYTNPCSSYQTYDALTPGSHFNPMSSSYPNPVCVQTINSNVSVLNPTYVDAGINLLNSTGILTFSTPSANNIYINQFQGDALNTAQIVNAISAAQNTNYVNIIYLGTANITLNVAATNNNAFNLVVPNADLRIEGSGTVTFTGSIHARQVTFGNAITTFNIRQKRGALSDNLRSVRPAGMRFRLLEKSEMINQ